MEPGGGKKLRLIGRHWYRPRDTAPTTPVDSDDPFSVVVERETDVPDVVEIWPEHQQVFRVWSAMSGQWRWCGDSPAALDLTPLPGVLDILEIPQAQREEVLLDLRWIEVGAIEEIRRQRREEAKRAARRSQ